MHDLTTTPEVRRRRVQYRRSDGSTDQPITELLLLESALIGSLALLIHIFAAHSWGMDWLAGFAASVFVVALAVWLTVKSLAGDIKVTHTGTSPVAPERDQVPEARQAAPRLLRLGTMPELEPESLTASLARSGVYVTEVQP